MSSVSRPMRHVPVSERCFSMKPSLGPKYRKKFKQLLKAISMFGDDDAEEMCRFTKLAVDRTR